MIANLTRISGILAIAGMLNGCVSLPEGVTTLLQTGQAGTEPADGSTCTATDTTPAVIETITEDILLKPAEIDAAGNITAPAVFETRTRQVITQERREVEFETPCPSDLTPEFIASLQRALKARGHYVGAISGVMDENTRQAVRSFQLQSGLNSAILSSETARQLGLLVTER
ncbi:MAG TPA: peptidoglycan-binding protein [Rhodobacteraceae bacterium]|nr:peptidoglycan-binding protein [Paracoccaceae bacterium]